MDDWTWARPPGLAPVPQPTGEPSPPPAEAEASTWESVADVDAGKPRVWLNFELPFAELPPIFIPPKPEMVRILREFSPV